MMKALLLSLTFLGISFALTAQPVIEWQKTFGGTGFDEPTDICLSNDGGYFLTGYVVTNDGDISGHHGGTDFWVVKLNALGVIQWQKALGGSGSDNPFTIRPTSDGGCIVIGETNSTDGDVTGNHGSYDYWIVKLSTTGALQWQKTLGGTGADHGTSIQQLNDGGYIAVGYSDSNNGDVTGNHSAYDVWVVRLNSTGTIQWQKSLGGNKNETAWSIQPTTDGGFVIASTTNSTVGDVTGYHGTYGGDIWVVKITGLGVIEWQKTYGGTSNDEATDIKQTVDGGFIVSGHTQSIDGDVAGTHGQQDVWVLKLNSTGTIEWQKVMGGSAEDKAYSIIQTQDGGYCVAAQTYSNNGDVAGNHGYGDAWVVKLTPQGAIHWKKAFGGSNLEGANSILQTADKGFIVTGRADSHNGDVTGTNGGSDLWVFKLGPEVVGTSSPTFMPKEPRLGIFPNPSTGNIFFNIPALEEDDIQIQIFDAMGRMIKQQIKSNGDNMDISSLPSGWYVASVIGASGSVRLSGKFQKE